MAENKTKPNQASATDYINSVTDEKTREDAFTILEMMREVSGEEPVMWGPAIVGFGSYHYKYDSGREGDFLKIGFSPRKGKFSLYVLCDSDEQNEMLTKLGKHQRGVSCLYIKRLSDIDSAVLREITERAWQYKGRGEA